MDAIHYAKIADQLMQFRGKLPNWDHVRTEQARNRIKSMNMAIESLLILIDEFAIADDMGWIE